MHDTNNTHNPYELWKTNKQIVPGCICSKYDESVWRYQCAVSGCECMFMIPDAVACARKFGEGPLADLEIMSDQSMRVEQLQEDVLDLTAENSRLTRRCEAMERALSGRCIGCVNAKPPKITTLMKFPHMVTCEHLGSAMASSGRRNCEHYVFDEARFAKEGGGDVE